MGVLYVCVYDSALCVCVFCASALTRVCISACVCVCVSVCGLHCGCDCLCCCLLVLCVFIRVVLAFEVTKQCFVSWCVLVIVFYVMCLFVVIGVFVL